MEMDMNRRSFIGRGVGLGLGSVFSLGTASVQADSKQSPLAVKAKFVRKGYYTVDGWLVSEQELIKLKEAGHVD
ncbi:hypothetical protein MAH1_18330 [Sessilibacter sp. MAH1]